MRLSEPTVDPGSIAWLNGLDVEDAVDVLRSCCAAAPWVDRVVRARPYGSLAALLETSDATLASLDDAGLSEALAAHARIGEQRGGDSREATWSRAEQASALAAGGDVRALLEQGNEEYEQRFGHVFLIRAAGRSPQEMYAALRSRLSHDAATERAVVLGELAEIVRLRLERLVAG